MVSTVGKILDPLADKLTQFILILCLSENHPVLNGMLGLLLIKEAFQLTAGFLLLRRGKMLDGALPSCKACTAVLFVTLTALVLFPDMEPAAVKAIALTNCVFLLLSFAAYIGVYFHPSGRIRDLGMQ